MCFQLPVDRFVVIAIFERLWKRRKGIRVILCCYLEVIAYADMFALICKTARVHSLIIKQFQHKIRFGGWIEAAWSHLALSETYLLSLPLFICLLYFLLLSAFQLYVEGCKIFLLLSSGVHAEHFNHRTTLPPVGYRGETSKPTMLEPLFSTLQSQTGCCKDWSLTLFIPIVTRVMHRCFCILSRNKTMYSECR